MGEYKGTIDRNETDDQEYAYFVPSYFEKGVYSQSVSICPLAHNELSMIILKCFEKEPTQFVHVVFTKEEVDILFNALARVKKAWESL